MRFNEEYLIQQLKNMIESLLTKSFEKNQIQNGGLLPVIDSSEKASLSKYGYKLSKSQLSRRRALKRAAKSTGTLRVLKRVNLIRNYSKSVPKNYDTLSSDVDFLKNTYAKEKLKKIIKRSN